MSDDPPDYVSVAISRDRRFAELQLQLAVEADMRDNATIRAFLAALETDAQYAMQQIAETSPADTSAMMDIGARVRAFAIVRRWLNTIVTRGKIAEAEIRNQDVANYAFGERSEND